MEGDGLILLEPELQRPLCNGTVVESASQPSSQRRHHRSNGSQTTESDDSQGNPSFAILGQPSVAMVGSPRTDFTTRGRRRTCISIPPTHGESFHGTTANSTWVFEIPSSSTTTEPDSEMEHQGVAIKLIVAGVALGVIAGALCQLWEVSSATVEWLNLPCMLFLRALQCVVVPYVFCSVAVAIGDIVHVGKISIVGIQTAKIFATLWVTTAIVGMTVATLFRPVFHAEKVSSIIPFNAVHFTCSNNETMMVISNGSVSCTASDVNNTAQETTFLVTEVGNVFTTQATKIPTIPGLNNLLYKMIQDSVSPNLAQSFTKNDLLSIIVFSMVLGSIAGRSFFMRSRRVNYLYMTLLQLRNALFLMMEWIIATTPLVLVSFIASTMARTHQNSHLVENFSPAIHFLLAVFCAAVIQMGIVLPAIVFFMAQSNPYKYMLKMVRVYGFSLATASSIATTPVILSCVKRARTCSQSLSNFVVSIGVSSSASAMGFYLPIAVTFLTESSGAQVDLALPRLFGLFVLTIVVCMGTPPVPAAALNVLISVYPQLTGAEQPPPSFIYVVAMDIIVDRIVTLCNVNGHIMALKIIAENTDETVTQELLGERS